MPSSALDAAGLAAQAGLALENKYSVVSTWYLAMCVSSTHFRLDETACGLAAKYQIPITFFGTWSCMKDQRIQGKRSCSGLR